MRTRNAGTPKSAAVKKTPPTRKSAAKGKTEEATSTASTDPNLEQPVEQSNATADDVEVTPEIKAATSTKTTKTVVRRTPGRTKAANAKAVSKQTPKLEEIETLKVEESSEKETIVGTKGVESSVSNVEEATKKEVVDVENVDEKNEDQVMHAEQSSKEEESTVGTEQPLAPDAEKTEKQEDQAAVNVVESSKSQEHDIDREEEVKEEMNQDLRMDEDKVETKGELVHFQDDVNNKLKGKDAQHGDECHGEERMEEHGNKEVVKEIGEEELAEDEMPVHGEDVETLEEERMELTAAAKERKIRKELEIFVGGLDRDAGEEDVKKAFESIGEVIEVRMNKNPSTNKNKGYAFVKFATKEQASRALSEMKNPLICGKRCGIAPNEDNDTLFLGNICNTWTKEAIKQKLKDYGIDGVENITLVPDAQHEGLSRGFAFLEFSCHADAMLAYKRLQKPDVVFGHPERTAKVAFAEPLREPDPEVMAQVKSVFVDGLPPHWDEDRVREQFKGYGEIVRIMLARNMSTAKRKDFGFVDFTSHEAAVACVEALNNTELGDGNFKTKVKARLSNPLPKTQAVKGGMSGGFRIGRGGAGSFSRSGRGFGRGAYAFNRPNFPRGRGFYQHGRGQPWRGGFTREHDLDIQYPPFQRREMFGRGGWRDSFGDIYDASAGGAVPARPNLDRMWHDAPDRRHGGHIPDRRPPFPQGAGFDRPFVGRHFDDPYFYDDRGRGMKRPFFMTDPDYIEPGRLRPPLDYSDAPPFQAPPYQADSFGAGSSLYSRDYYGSDYGQGSYSSYRNGRPYGSDYYY
ncbi:hypothetical protein NMG60_11007882 [Bertholletia excelsa]